MLTTHFASTSHTTSLCTSPFGLSSLFGRATSHRDKYIVVQKSVAAGWSPQATHVRVPKGFQLSKSTDSNSTSPSPKTTDTTEEKDNPLLINSSTIQPSELESYHKVKSMLESLPANSKRTRTAYQPQPFAQPPADTYVNPPTDTTTTSPTTIQPQYTNEGI